MSFIARASVILFFVAHLHNIDAQETGPGIGIYPTGTETGLGFRSSRTTKFALDLRITRASLFFKPQSGTFINECSIIYRIAFYEKVRFHIGLGARSEWNPDPLVDNRYGGVMPIGVEAFPFPFQNAGLFFEAAPFYTFSGNISHNAGIRTVVGIAFYFIKNTVQTESTSAL